MATLIDLTECTLLKGSEKQRCFYVRFNERPANFAEVLAATGLPVEGDPYSDTDPRQCKTRNVSSLGTTTDFYVTADYEPAEQGELDPNPLARKDEISGDFGSESETYFKDHSSTPKFVLNSAGECFESFPERTTGAFGITITGNRASFSPSLYASYLRPNAVNSDSVTVRGIPIGVGEAKLTGISFSRQTEGAYSFWQVKWSLALAPSWDQEINDRGYNQKVGTRLEPITVLVGAAPNQVPERVTKPHPLYGSGAKKTNPYDDPAVLTFKPYPARAFGVFNWTQAV
jgi:hypothetical protein